ESVALDLQAGVDEDGSDAAQAAAEARQIGIRLLRRLQPGATLQPRGGIFGYRARPIDPFTEVMQIRDAIAALAAELAATLARCHSGPPSRPSMSMRRRRPRCKRRRSSPSVMAGG